MASKNNDAELTARASGAYRRRHEQGEVRRATNRAESDATLPDDAIRVRHQACPLCGRESFAALPQMRRVELVRCATCDGVFTPKIPSLRELMDHYEGYPRAEKVDSPISRRAREGWLDRFESYRETNRFLDVGCDIGLLLDQARARGWETYGTEFTDEAVTICRDNGHCLHAGLLCEADLEPESFDVVVYTEVIEHINNQRDEFARVFELLRPGGVLYITTPNFDSLSRRVLGDRWTVIDYPEHLVYFTPKTLRRFMASAGFEEVHLESSGVSVSRLTSSLRPPAPRMKAANDDAPPLKRDIRADELIRGAMENSAILGGAKTLVNRMLHHASLGDSIKASFRKPSD